MKAFVVELDNRPGELARVTEAIASKGINITAGAGIGYGATGGFAVMTNDEMGTRNALRDVNCTFREIDVLPASVADEAGALASVARKLADAGVNIEFVIPTGMSDGKMVLALGVDKIDAARTALGERMTAMA